MHHDTALIALVAVGFVLACAFGYLAIRVRLPPIVGYLVAGIAVGPFTPGFVGDAGIAGQLAEIGVILLMFGVGVHFSLDTLLAVRGIAVPGAIAQIVVATAIGTASGESDNRYGRAHPQRSRAGAFREGGSRSRDDR